MVLDYSRGSGVTTKKDLDSKQAIKHQINVNVL